MNKILILVLIIFMVVAGSAIYMLFTPNIISGTVVDCKTNEPIAKAHIIARQIGWDFSEMVWDKVYDVSATSWSDGSYSIDAVLSKPVRLIVSKEGYVEAKEAFEIGSGKTVRLLQGKPEDFGKGPGYIVYTKNCQVQ